MKLRVERLLNCREHIADTIQTSVYFPILTDDVSRWLLLLLPVNGIRVKRQEEKVEKKEKEETFEQELCKDKDAGEWFRLVANDGDSCRDVIQCTSSVSF